MDDVLSALPLGDPEAIGSADPAHVSVSELGKWGVMSVFPKGEWGLSRPSDTELEYRAKQAAEVADFHLVATASQAQIDLLLYVAELLLIEPPRGPRMLKRLEELMDAVAKESATRRPSDIPRP